MTARFEAELAGAAILILAIALLAGSWLAAREDSIRMKATIDEQSQAISAAQKSARDIQAAEDARDKTTAASVAALEKAAAKQATPQQIAAWIPKQLPVPQPITFTVPAATKENPAPPATAEIPQVDLPALRDQIESCQECAVKLSTAQSDLQSRADQLKLAGQQLSAMTIERDAAVKASRGGGFWTRVKSKSKWLFIGVGVGAAAVCGSGHCK